MNKKNIIDWTDEERDRVVGLFDLLMKMDRKQNPYLYKAAKDNKNRVVLDKDGNEITL